MTTPYALLGEVFAPEAIGPAAVVVRDGKILDLVRSPHAGDLPQERREVSGMICPGFIDLQINGAFGIDVGPDTQALKALARELPKTGTTSFLPTLISSPPERYADFLEALKELMRAPSPSGAIALGAHLEGPFLALDYKGAHDPANLRPPDSGLAEEFVSSGVVRLVTLAPELEGAKEVIRLFSDNGIVASAGHTAATYEEMLRAIDAGISMGTHLYNAMSPLKHRAPGAIGALLSDDRVRVGIIPDGVHAHVGALKIAYRQKGAQGLALVTDAMEAAGMPPGEYELSGRQVRLDVGAVRLSDGILAGSALTMDRAVLGAVELLRIPMRDAVRMASETPAEALGMPEKGRIRPGADADLVVLTQDGAVQETIVAGRSVYRREEKP